MQTCNIKARIRELRRAKGLTQEELSRLTGIHRVTIARYETKERGITLANMLKIASVLDCTLDDLVDRSQDADA